MNIRRAVAGLALGAALAFVAGCQGSNGLGGAAPDGSKAPPPAAAADELKAAITKLGATTHKYTVKVDDSTFLGFVEPSAKAVKVTTTMTAGSAKGDVELIVVNDDHYARVTGLQLLGLDPSKWLHLDGRRIESLARFGITDVLDPLGLAVLSSGIASAERTGDRSFRGTFDLSKPAAGISDKDIKDLADKAKNIPFEATLDAEGRLSTVKFTIPARGNQPARTVDMTISDYGAKVDVTRPVASQVVEAPDIVYSFINAAT